MTEAHAGGGDELLLRRCAAIGLAELEQRAVGKAAVAVPLRRIDQPRQQRGPHDREL